MDESEHQSSPSSAAKPRIPYACEACRVAKVKCTPSTTLDICRRCSVSKRECVFKTGPRKRRRRDKLRPAATRKTPPPSAPSKTFTIDVPLPGGADMDVEPSESLDALRDAHLSFVDDLVPEDDPYHDEHGRPSAWASSSTSGGGTLSGSTPSVASRSVHGLSNIQPQFNLDSAASLLDSFRDGMLTYFPVISLPADATVPSLAKEQPFVLLAILAAASGGRSMQGHSLYDDEFRKVLGLKFVSGGERSLELLVGLQIYCAWYPFHLRPKQRQASQYIRMAADIVHDLDLDQPPDNSDQGGLETDEKFLAGVRAYLGCYYLCASISSIWSKKSSLPFGRWTATCCDILERSKAGGQAATADQSLACLARLSNVFEETSSLIKRKGQLQHEDHHVSLMVKGMEAQLQEWKCRRPEAVFSNPVVHIANLFTEIYLQGYPLLKYPYQLPKKQISPSQDSLVDPNRLLSCTQALRNWYDYISSLPDAEFANFSAIDWGHFIGMIILGLRLSFPLPRECPSWDHAAARGIVRLGSFLERFTRESDDSADLAPASSSSNSSTDVLSASKVVLGVVRSKYDKRLAALEKAALMQPPHPIPLDADAGLRRCPMFDGSLDPFIELWDDAFLDPSSFADAPFMSTGMAAVPGAPGAGSSADIQPAVYHDLWATMTMGWSADNFTDLDSSGI